MTINVLLVCDPHKSHWIERLQSALGELINTLAISQMDATEYFQKQNSDLIVIDKAAVEDVNGMIKRLHFVRSSAKIIVAAEIPTWEEARAAFQSGAFDYVSAEMSPEELGGILRDIASIQ